MVNHPIFGSPSWRNTLIAMYLHDRRLIHWCSLPLRRKLPTGQHPLGQCTVFNKGRPNKAPVQPTKLFHNRPGRTSQQLDWSFMGLRYRVTGYRDWLQSPAATSVGYGNQLLNSRLSDMLRLLLPCQTKPCNSQWLLLLLPLLLSPPQRQPQVKAEGPRGWVTLLSKPTFLLNNGL